jgi:glycosyltransferase involved in cell wall biosynthesis
MIKALHSGTPSPNPGTASLPHVLLVVDQFPKALGGGERVLLKLASLLPQYGFRASILTLGVHPETTALNAPPCPVYLLPITRTYDLHAMKAALHLRRFLKEQNIQIVQTFFESSDIWAGFVTKSLSRARLIWSRRDMGILRTSKHHRAYKLMSGMPDAVFAVSHLVRQHCIEVDGISPERVFTIHNGLDLSAWTTAQPATPPAPRPHDRISITTVGNIRRVKGHDVLIKAAAAIVPQFPQTCFSIVGAVLEQDYFAELQTLVKDLDLTGHIHFAGAKSQLHDHLASSDIFVLPSRSEGFSNAIVEAMAASLPVVATDVGGNAEAVRDGITGFIVPPEAPAALAAAIKRLLADPHKAAEMGDAGRSLAAQEFTLEVMMNRTTAIYRQLLATR